MLLISEKQMALVHESQKEGLLSLYLQFYDSNMYGWLTITVIKCNTIQ